MCAVFYCHRFRRDANLYDVTERDLSFVQGLCARQRRSDGEGLFEGKLQTGYTFRRDRKSNIKRSQGINKRGANEGEHEIRVY